MNRFRVWCALFLVGSCLVASSAIAQTAAVAGAVRDETGGALPGVSVELRGATGSPLVTVSDAQGTFSFDRVAAGHYEASFLLINFASTRRDLDVPSSGTVRVDAVLHLSLSADVTVTGKRTFTNLADVANPAENLVGVALSASQGAITARQLDARPIMRSGEVLETVPGVVISQHSGEGKANQYYLRGFNLDHGTDFATTLAGMPVNMPTHGHGHGYSDLNFLIPELVSGVQFAKGPYFADQGDFATAGSANINYASVLDRPIVRVGGGDEGFARAMVAASPAVGRGHLLAALEVEHNDGPWLQPDDYRQVNGVVRYSRGDAVNGLSVTGMGYRAKWNSTDQVPSRAIDQGIIDRFGALDTTDGGDTYRYSGSVEWQRTRNNATTKITAYGIGYDLNLFSNFTFFLDDPEHGDQFHQADHRFVSGARASYRRIGRWGGREVQNTVGVQLRNDDISNVGLYHTKARQLLNTIRQDGVLQTSGAGYAQNEIVWAPWLRTLAGLRLDGYRFKRGRGRSRERRGEAGGDRQPQRRRHHRPVQRHGALRERGARLSQQRRARRDDHPRSGVGQGGRTRDAARPREGGGGGGSDGRDSAPAIKPDGLDALPGVRAAVCRRCGDDRSRPAEPPLRDRVRQLLRAAAVADSRRRRVVVERALHRQPIRWATTFPVRSRPSSRAGRRSTASTTSSAASACRYFGPRALIEDDSIRSRATSLINLEGGYKITRRLKIAVDVFNLLDAKDSDIDYYYTSRLFNEPAGGVTDIHLHPTLPRTARVNLIVGF